MNKILSIIVPSYNMEKYLPKCLDSLIVEDAELLQKLDVIVVNDGSKDRTSEIAHEFERKHPGGFRVIDKPNGHYGSCINAGLAVASGVYVRVLDADDSFNTYGFEKYLHFLLAQSTGRDGADLVVSDFAFINNGERTERRYDYVNESGFNVSGFDYSPGHDIWMHAVAYKTQNIKDLDYRQIEGITHTDVQWLNLPMTTVNKIAYSPEVVYEYYESRAGNTSDEVGYYRTFHDLAAVSKKVIEECNQYVDRVGVTQSSYLRKHAYFRAMRVYKVCLLKRNPLLRPGIVEDFDAYLYDHARWLYDALDTEVLGGKLRFHYIREWRKHKKISLKLQLMIALQKMYGNIRGIGK